MLRAFAAGLLALVSNSALPQAPETSSEPMRVEGTARWGTFVTFKEPYFPPALVETRARMHVDISGRILWSGELADVEYTPGSEEAKALIAPLRGVVPYWRLVAPRDRKCQPSDRPMKTRVTVDFGTDPPTVGTQVPDALFSWTIRPVTKVDPKYPRDMLNMGLQSHVYARSTLDAAGNVTDVLAIAYPQRPDADLTPFVDATVQALRQWTFPPADAQRKGDRQVCWHFFYQVVSSERKKRAH